MEKTETVFLQAVSYGLKAQVMENPNLTEEEWKKILRQSVLHSVLPLVFEAVYPYLTKELEIRYRSYTLSWIMNQVRASDEFISTYKKLLETGIQPLVFKGIICRDAYLLSDWRISADEDIYVRREEYTRLHACLIELGFQCRKPNFQSEHETVYYKEHLKLEGHWELFPQENYLWREMNVLSEEIIQHAVCTEIDGIPILTPEPTDHMIYLFLHAMKHFSLAGVGIRQICDIVMWDRKYQIDWNRVKETMSGAGALVFAEAVLDAGNKYFGMQIPDGWKRRDCSNLIQDSLNGGVFGHSSSDRLHSASITSADGTTGHYTAFNILKAVFPSRPVMEINYPWVSKSSLFLPVGWGVRLIKYAAKIGRGNSPWTSIRIGTQRVKLMKEYGVFQNDNFTS